METVIWTRCRNVHQHVGRHLEEFCPGISGTGRSVQDATNGGENSSNGDGKRADRKKMRQKDKSI